MNIQCVDGRHRHGTVTSSSHLSSHQYRYGVIIQKAITTARRQALISTAAPSARRAKPHVAQFDCRLAGVTS